MARDSVVRPGARRRSTSPEASLAVLYPEIAAEWHPTKNGRLTPADVLPRAVDQVWWRCATDPSHAWQTQVTSRRKGSGCPACAGQLATPKTSLRVQRPDVAARWHPSENGRLTPDDVLPGSARQAWWVCAADAGHVWQAKVMSVTGSTRGGCPFCSGRRVTTKTSLHTCFPEIAADWHPDKNGELSPHDVTWNSQRRVFWRCGACQHVWQTAIGNRSAGGTGCPACAGKAVTPQSSFRALYPDLAREWHPTKNGALTADDVRPGSAKRVAWRCTQDPAHEWQTTVNARTSQNSGCPFCTGRRATPETSLAALHPRLAREWHPEKNAPLTARDVRPGSQRKVWWRCHRDRSHVWESIIAPRAGKGVGCPFCARKVATPKTSLAALNRRIAREWHPTNNEPLTPQDVMPGSGRKVWWQCRTDASHAWEARVYNRTIGRGTGCPICSGHLVTPETSLRGRLPELAAQWHPTKNRPLTPDDVVPGSNRRVWWICRAGRGHVWATVVANRASRGDGCPHCAKANRRAGAR